MNINAYEEKRKTENTLYSKRIQQVINIKLNLLYDLQTF